MTHRDLKLDHMLFDRGRPGLIDMGACCAADPVLDPAKVLASMFSAPFEQGVPADSVRPAMAAFSDAYFSSVPRAWQDRIDPHYVGALLGVGTSLFRRQIPGWAESVGALVGEAERALR
jgi:hypothetical protein